MVVGRGGGIKCSGGRSLQGGFFLAGGGGWLVSRGGGGGGRRIFLPSERNTVYKIRAKMEQER